MDTTITLELPASLYARLQNLAREEETDPVEMINRLIAIAAARPLHQPTPSEAPTLAFQRILERATDLGVTDLAENHDHYLYGTDRQ